MKFGSTSTILSAVAGLWLAFTGMYEWGTQSAGASSWSDETSIAALQVRAQGTLKIGLGIGFLALASAGSIPVGSVLNPDFKSEFDKREEPLTSTTTPKAPRPKAVYGANTASTMPVKPPTFKKD